MVLLGRGMGLSHGTSCLALLGREIDFAILILLGRRMGLSHKTSCLVLFGREIDFTGNYYEGEEIDHEF